MITSKRKYLNACLTMPPEWLKLSIQFPSSYMTPVHILLHRIALRKLS